MNRKASRVLHLCAVSYTAETVLLPQLRFLASAGYDVRLGCGLEPQGWGALAPFKPSDVSFPRSLDVVQSVRALRQVVHTAQRIRPDLIHLHSPAAALQTRLLPKWLFPSEMKMVYTVHGFYHQWDSDGLAMRAIRWLERLEAPRVDALLFQSCEDFRNAQIYGFKTRLTYLGNGVEELWFDIPVATKPRRPLNLLFVGRLVREKGILDLLDAIQSVPNVQLAIVGAQSASERDGVEREVARLATSPDLHGRVQLHGFLAKERLAALMATVDAFVLPSYREGVPRSLIEALAAGRPAIVTDVRGSRELVREGENGIVIPPGRPDLLAQAIDRLCNTDASVFERYSRTAKASVAQRRESEVFGRLADVYRDLGVMP